jgi:hypothetical protein
MHLPCISSSQGNIPICRSPEAPLKPICLSSFTSTFDVAEVRLASMEKSGVADQQVELSASEVCRLLQRVSWASEEQAHRLHWLRFRHRHQAQPGASTRLHPSLASCPLQRRCQGCRCSTMPTGSSCVRSSLHRSRRRGVSRLIIT